MDNLVVYVRSLLLATCSHAFPIIPYVVFYSSSTRSSLNIILSSCFLVAYWITEWHFNLPFKSLYLETRKVKLISWTSLQPLAFGLSSVKQTCRVRVARWMGDSSHMEFRQAKVQVLTLIFLTEPLRLSSQLPEYPRGWKLNASSFLCKPCLLVNFQLLSMTSLSKQ